MTDRPTIADVDQKKVEEGRRLIASSATVGSRLGGLLGYLPACEYELILFMANGPDKVWKGPVPSPPDGFKPGDGAIELGLFLYWLQHPETLDLSVFSPGEALKVLELILVLYELLPSSKMTDENYDFFKTDELIYSDGTVLGMEKYANFDQQWFIAFLNCAQTIRYDLWYNGYSFPTTAPEQPIPLVGAMSGTVDIAILGDWGTGEPAAKAVMKQITSLCSDYILHVGDVYYGGTPLATSPTGENYFAPGEETANLLDMWPSGFEGRSFTLNSNHEMYSGANGLFYEALGAANDPPGSGTPFSAQQGSSCFALSFGGWTLLCLDTAFDSSLFDVFMVGSIGSANGTQGKWVQSLNLDPGKTIVVSHHNGFADDTTSVSPLWEEVKGALKGDPYAWYWGHVHNGIVYDRPISIDSFETKTYARCLGHAAIPYGTASLLVGEPVAWQASSVIPSDPKQLYNGFAMLSLTENAGQVTITEKFYDPSSQDPKWTKQIFPAI